MNFDQIPPEDAEKIKKRLIEQISAMNESELKIVAQSEKSLAHYIAEAFQAFARLLGYVIAYPIALAAKIAESMFEGFKQGWKDGFRAAGIDL